MVTTPKAGDYTGNLRAQQQKALAKELNERKDEISLATRAEAEAIETETIDVTGRNASVPTVIDEVEELSDGDDEGTYEVIRVAEDVEDATIASHEGIRTYTFQQGRKYRVPENVAFVLRERGLIYDRA